MRELVAAARFSLMELNSTLGKFSIESIQNHISLDHIDEYL